MDTSSTKLSAGGAASAICSGCSIVTAGRVANVVGACGCIMGGACVSNGWGAILAGFSISTSGDSSGTSPTVSDFGTGCSTTACRPYHQLSQYEAGRSEDLFAGSRSSELLVSRESFASFGGSGDGGARTSG